MIFNYTANFYVGEESIEEMLNYHKQGYSYEQSICMAASGWDDDRYYGVEEIAPQLIKELERRMEAERG